MCSLLVLGICQILWFAAHNTTRTSYWKHKAEMIWRLATAEINMHMGTAWTFLNAGVYEYMYTLENQKKRK